MCPSHFETKDAAAERPVVGSEIVEAEIEVTGCIGSNCQFRNAETTIARNRALRNSS